MKIKENSEIIEQHRRLTFSPQPEIYLNRPCKLGDGIIQHAEFERNKFRYIFEKAEGKINFFIPASGSGSRMFKFLYEFLESPDEKVRSQTERFLNKISSFAFFELLPYTMKNKVKNYDINLDDFITYLLKEEGLGLGSLPKGLIPFHRSRSFILNAFQEQLLQGLRLKDEDIHFHFTVNPDFEKEIKKSLKAIQHLLGRDCGIELSEQDVETNSIAFDDEKNLVYTEDGEILTRPSGHGALLKNLNTLKGDIIFVKNIDNVQHEIYAHQAIDHFKYLGGLLCQFKHNVAQILSEGNRGIKLEELNQQYQFLPLTEDYSTWSDEEVEEILNRPMRVCGMVRNEGQPGGGPFWVEDKGVLSKQIVEKSQINNNGDQYKKMVQSQYFNPVLMALNIKDKDGKIFDLQEFADLNKYFKVEKTHKDQVVHFIERPGLWNGSMANWISIFVEAPATTFTPVKTVLDLLDDAHQE